LDLNLGCPSDNVINQGAGSALLKRPVRVKEIISCWQGLGKPVTAKIRSDQNILRTIRLAKEIERAGASAISIHGRTVKQENKGMVDFVAIKRVKKAVGIPVIGNGGIANKAGFERMLEKTGCDAAMVGTAAIGNPGVFAEILGKKPIAREQAFLKYLELCKKHGLNAYPGRMKTQAVRFFANQPEKMRLFEKAQGIEGIAGIAEGPKN
jgi:tRNA-dihydrouridine synthase